MKAVPRDVKLAILTIRGELHELKRFTIDMADAFGLDRRIEVFRASGPSDFIAGILVAC